jgi:aspartyl-tRNA(Asn)/glutamyl-tRNA(Gln) amidotransferase subunit A
MYQKLLISDLRNKLDNNEVTKEELFNEANLLAHKYQSDINSFVTIIDKFKSKESSSKLNGIPYALKDNISTSNILTTACSNILKDYVPVYDATVYKKLKNSGAVLVGKTSMDELAMGGTGTTGNNGIVKNPWDTNRLIGGSSAGSASCVALGIVPFSIGSDTGDSIRKPAANGGVVGFKPTYGRISRYGLFAFASSLDHVGCFTRSVRDAAIVTDVLKGYDKHDMTSLVDDNKIYEELIDNDVKGKKLFYFKDVCNLEHYDSKDSELISVLTKFKETIEKIKELGITVEEVEFPHELLTALYPTYMTLSCAEATSNNSNLTGIQFGPRAEGNNIDEIMFNARTKGFSELIKRRFVLGSYILQKENQEKLYLNACRVRRLVVDKMNEIFKSYDGLIMPASGGIAPKYDSATDKLSDKYLILENHLVIGNFGGFPSITLPSGFVNGMPICINITGHAKEDDVVLNIANKIEEKLGYKGIIVGDKNV